MGSIFSFAAPPACCLAIIEARIEKRKGGLRRRVGVGQKNRLAPMLAFHPFPASPRARSGALLDARRRRACHDVSRLQYLNHHKAAGRACIRAGSSDNLGLASCRLKGSDDNECEHEMACLCAPVWHRPRRCRLTRAASLTGDKAAGMAGAARAGVHRYGKANKASESRQAYVR